MPLLQTLQEKTSVSTTSNGTTTTGRGRMFKMIDTYLYFYHTNTLLVIPAYAETVNDSTSVSFSSETPLSRSAPIFSYQNSGPRSLTVSFRVHRDMMEEINYGVSNAQLGVTDDYTDYMIKALQACAMPSYSNSTKTVTPPVLALRMGSDIFIKGVLQSSFGLTYNFPMMTNKKDPDGPAVYSNIDFSITIVEIEPYDAEDVMSMGSFRGNLSTSLIRNALYNLNSSTDASYGSTKTTNIDGNAVPTSMLKDPEFISSTGANSGTRVQTAGGGAGKNVMEKY